MDTCLVVEFRSASFGKEQSFENLILLVFPENFNECQDGLK
jgi:hypothetical protein